ncbi:hypothetical protein ACFQ08_34825, partial [Streptosporangium algeriense]
MTAHRVGVGRAHGKAILLGEHTVVYGTPAIAVPLPALTVTAVVRPCPGQAPGDEGDAGPQASVAALLRRWGRAGDRLWIAFDCAVPPARGLG